jgi:hypothetical protein
LVYSIDNAESFEEVKRLRDAVLQVKGTDPQPPIVVVGNKSDVPESGRVIQIEMAECECIDWDHGFVECSAKNNENVVNIFSSMLIQARLKGTLPTIPTSKSNQNHSHRDHNSLTSNGIDHVRHNQRRRSSLPISELFHHHRSTGISGSGVNAVNFAHNSRASGTFRKRNSCTPS